MTSLLGQVALRTRKFFYKHHSAEWRSQMLLQSQPTPKWEETAPLTWLKFSRSSPWGPWADSICVTREVSGAISLLEFHSKHSYRWLTACHNTLQLPFQKGFLQNEVSRSLSETSIFFTPFGLAVKMLSNCLWLHQGVVSNSCESKTFQQPKTEPRGSREITHRLQIH